MPEFRRRVYLARYGEPPDPPATAAFVTALHHAVEQVGYAGGASYQAATLAAR